MSFLNSDEKYFSETQPDELNLFTLPPTQTAVEKVYVQEVRPISQISGNSPIEFHISSHNALEYVDLRNTTLYVRAKLKRASGKNLVKEDVVAPVNLLHHAIWSQCEVSLQGKLVTSSTVHYPYRAMFQVLGETDAVTQNSRLTSEMFFKDTQEKMDVTGYAEGNNGLFMRHELSKLSRSFDMEAPLYGNDLFRLKRYILNQVDIQVKLYRSKPSFYLMANKTDQDYELVLEDVVLKATKICVNPGVIWGHNEALSVTPSKYPFNRTEMKTMAIAKGQSSFIWDNVFQSLRPSKVYISFVSSEAVNGDFKKNPFNFQHFDLNQINLFCEGISYSNAGPMKLDYDKASGQTILPMYLNLFRSRTPFDGDNPNLSRNEIDGSYAIYLFTLDPTFESLENKEYLNLQKQGNIRIEAHFGKTLPETVTCLVYAEFPGYFEIDKARAVIV